MAIERKVYNFVRKSWPKNLISKSLRKCKILFAVYKWDEHTKFMDALVDDGFIVLGGPLDGEKVLLILNAESRQAIDARLAGDPWTPMGVRRIAKVERLEILLSAPQ